MNTSIFMSIKDKIPQDSHLLIKDKIDNLDDKKIGNISMLNLKDPTIGLVLGLFLGVFGIDRFYKGDILLGILKLVTFGGIYIWAIIDLFIVSKGIKKDNLEKINLVI